MNVKTGKLLWEATYQGTQYESIDDDVSCEVVIIGGGLFGACCAYFLGEAGAKTILVEKRKIGYGSTIANTGLIQFCNDKTLSACMDTFGEERAVRFYRSCLHSIEQLANIVPHLHIDPHFVRRKSLYYASEKAHVSMLQKEYETLKRYEFPVEYMTEQQIKEAFSFSKPGAIYTGSDAEVNPYRLVHGFIEKAKENGVNIYENTEIVHHIKEKENIILLTKNNKRISTKKVIFALGYEAQEVKKEKNAILTSSYALVTQPLPAFEWKEQCLMWETARPYLYIRRTPDKRIIIGGLDEKAISREEQEAMLVHKKKQLLKELKKLFPANMYEAEYYWAATFGGTHDGMPMIREYEGYEGCYFLLGYGGNGIVYSLIFAEIMRDLLTKGTHPNRDLFMS